MNALTNGATITVVQTGEQYHTLNDWGLAIGNNDYIGEPVPESYYVEVPGRNGGIDMSDVVSGRRSFKYRPIKIVFAGIRPRMNWDMVVSEIRNILEGQMIKITFDNDIAYYWKGRAKVTDFDRVRELGTFTLSIPKADPYKYNIQASTEEWLWDPFDFDTGVIFYGADMQINDTVVSVPKGRMPVTAIFIVREIASESLSVTYNGIEYALQVGRNRFPGVLVADGTERSLTFKGTGTVSIEYRGGSL